MQSRKILGKCRYLVFFLLSCLFLLYFFDNTIITAVKSLQNRSCPHINITNFIEQRDKVAKLMNKLSQKVAILTCELNKKEKKKSVSNVGGWCERKVDQDSNIYGHFTDIKFALTLAEFLKEKKVASFGDGRGTYKSIIDNTTKVTLYHAYDGGPYYSLDSPGHVRYLDLTLPQYGLPVYDWVVSLEVAEHIPAEFEDIYLDNIIRHASEGIVLSWAKPGQKGFHHVNLKPFNYVIAKLSDLGFTHDNKSSVMLQNAAKLGWLKRNTNVYYRNHDILLHHEYA